MEKQSFDNGLVLDDGFLKLGNFSWPLGTIKSVKIIKRPWLLEFVISTCIGAFFFKVAVQQVLKVGFGGAMPMIIGTCIFSVWIASALRRRGILDVYISTGITPTRIFSSASETKALSVKVAIEKAVAEPSSNAP